MKKKNPSTVFLSFNRAMRAQEISESVNLDRSNRTESSRNFCWMDTVVALLLDNDIVQIIQTLETALVTQSIHLVAFG